MHHAIYRITLKPGSIKIYQSYWRVISGYMTQYRGALSSKLYYNVQSNECIIHSMWSSETAKKSNWPLPTSAPNEVKYAEENMKNLRENIDNQITIGQLIVNGPRLTFQGKADVFFELAEEVKSEKTKILIYNDEGCGTECVQETYNSLMNCIDRNYCQILIINADYLLQVKGWEDKTRLLIMPGGRARPYYTALGSKWETTHVPPGDFRKLTDVGDGNQRIINFVRVLGGNYLGLCAGAYYGAAKTVFEKGGGKTGEFEVLDNGALNFFNGVAEGPAYGLKRFDYNSEDGAELAEIVSTQLNIDSLPVYFNGGCYFHSLEVNTNEANILAKYKGLAEGKNISIIELKCGMGIVTLSGIHIEFSSLAKNLSSSFKKELAQSDDKRLIMFAKIVNRLSIPLCQEIELKIIQENQQNLSDFTFSHTKGLLFPPHDPQLYANSPTYSVPVSPVVSTPTAATNLIDNPPVKPSNP